MKKLILISVLAMLCQIFPPRAAAQSTNLPLKTGDQVPDVLIKNLYNFRSPAIRLSDVKEELIIFDFWATWCSSCIKTFPKIEALQQSYEGKVRFLLVNSKDSRDDAVKIKSFFTRHAYPYKLPTVVEDTLLSRLFPHSSIPHYVWIHKGTVLAITDAEAINAGKIEEALSSKNIRLKEKVEIPYRPGQPLFVDGNGGKPPVYRYQTLLAPYIDGLGALMSFHYVNDTQIDRCQFVNWTIPELYRAAYPQIQHFERNRIVYRVSNPAALATDSTSECWAAKNRFVYESSFPPMEKPKVLACLRADLERYFHLNLDSAFRDTDCLVLRRNAYYRPRRKPKSAIMKTNLYDQDGQDIYLENGSLELLAGQLNRLYPIPVIVDSGSEELVSLHLPGDLKNETQLRQSLTRQGFDLVHERRRLLFLLIHEH